MNQKQEEMLKLVKHYHKDQSRNNGKVPYWQHCQSTAEILNYAFMQTKETSNDFNDLLLAAIGHDLYEDTQINPKDIEKQFGIKVHSLIVGMTNYEGDNDRNKYLTKIKKSSEEIRLIKICDMIENMISSAYGIHDNGAEWTSNFLLPIINESRGAIAQTTFKKYNKVAHFLLKLSDFAYERLIDNLNKNKAHKGQS